MRRDLIASITAVLALTVLLGLGYPLLMTGIAQVAMPVRADGSPIRRDGELVGSRQVAQAFADEDGAPLVGYFQPRPSQTGYAANASSFLNQGPNQQELADLFAERRDAYLELEGAYHDDLDADDVPVDAVTNSGSGIDPHVSIANARIQAARVADERGAELAEVLGLVDEHVDGRALGLFGEPGVNVLELNLSIDEEYPVR